MSLVIEVQDVHQRYGAQAILRGVHFALQPGDISCILGPSGSGKTTLLRCLAGFEKLSQGSITLNGSVVSSPTVLIEPEHRGMGIVFQDYALFPHLSVSDNILFGIRKWTSNQKAERLAELLQLVDLSEHAKKYPHQLSGGQQQRVALARALAAKPSVVLLDEPFSNLDVSLREQLAEQVRTILKRENTTAIMVTHDQHEAFAMADHIGVLRNGVIEQWDSAYALYHEPQTRFIADFIGQGVFLPGHVLTEQKVSTELGKMTLDEDNFKLGDTVDVLIRPDDVLHDDDSPTTAIVRAKAFRGAQFMYTLELPSGQRIYSLVPSHHNHPLGTPIGIRLEVDHVIAFAR